MGSRSVISASFIAVMMASLTIDIISTRPLSALSRLSWMSKIRIMVFPTGSAQRGPFSIAQLNPAIIDSLTALGISVVAALMRRLPRKSSVHKSSSLCCSESGEIDKRSEFCSFGLVILLSVVLVFGISR